MDHSDPQVRLLQLQQHHGDKYYEESGNYVYRFSPYELTQCALGTGFPYVAFRFVHRVKDPPHNLSGERLKGWFQRQRRRQRRTDMLRGVDHRPLVCFAIFKSRIEGDLRRRLSASGFDVPNLPVNPHLASAHRSAA